MRVFFAVLAVIGATAAQAQQVDRSAVQACYSGAAIGDTTPACLGQASNACQIQGHTTTQGIVQCIQAETQAWDALLNTEYKALRADLGNRNTTVSGNQLDLNEQLLTAQRAWIAYRDAECSFAYARWQDGSIRSVVHANCLMVMTARRTIELRQTLRRHVQPRGQVPTVIVMKPRYAHISFGIPDSQSQTAHPRPMRCGCCPRLNSRPPLSASAPNASGSMS